MLLFLVHHGAAVDSTVDTMRPLSAEGIRLTEALARLAAQRGIAPAHVWHSGKLRAKQTAELYWRHCNALASFRAARGLQPSDDPAAVRSLVHEAEGQPLMLVGHYPHLPAAFALLTSGSGDRTSSGSDGPRPFPQNGLVALESDEGRLWREVMRLNTGEVA